MLTVPLFVAKWKAANLSERSSYQQHFLDLCALLDVTPPAEADPTGASFTFEKGVAKADGGKGFADVWRRGCFGWEYKGKHKDLNAAYRQLQNYREALENPPLLVVCDLETFVVRTNFTGTPTERHEFHLDDLADPKTLGLLRNLFHAPYELRPGKTQKEITEEVAAKFARLADGLRGRGVEPEPAAHFLMKLMFCMFAEDIDLLPRDLFTKTVGNAKGDPARLTKFLTTLFHCMATGEEYGSDEIAWFNGGLFADAAVIDLTPAEIVLLHEAALCDWSAVEPSIFGTLFERTLNPVKRSQLGAHYTGETDIAALIGPVMVDPLRREWAAVQKVTEGLFAASKGAKAGSKPKRAFEQPLNDFLYRLAHVTVLDPACGSGNFLYVAIKELLSLEKEVLTYMGSRGLTAPIPFVRPAQLRGIEVNRYARELAQVVVWIGYLQWMKFNGFLAPNKPVLDTMETIENRDAVLDLSDPANPKEPAWPDAEFLIGNPPFLGGNKVRAELGDAYVEALFKVYAGRLPSFSDLVCYWFEKARAKIEAGTVKRVGLVATQGIRGGVNRKVLERVKESGDIFFGVSDRNWELDGATVHISLVGFDNGTEQIKYLDEKATDKINSDLTTGTDATTANCMFANLDIWCYGSQQKAKFDISTDVAVQMLHEPNAWGKPNSDVIRVSLGARQMTQRTSDTYVIDFGQELIQEVVSRYEKPFEWVKSTIYPRRKSHSEPRQRNYWWLHARPSPRYRVALSSLSRYIVVMGTGQNRIFVWQDTSVLVDHSLIVFLRDDDYFMGVVHSRIHDCWTWRTATQVRERESGLRYTPTTCFETFPFPEPTDAQREAVAAAAKELDGLRSNWLNPPEWTATETLTFPGSVGGPWRRYVTEPDARGVGTVRYPRTVPKSPEHAARLKDRTLTKLYNEPPAWLKNAHAKLDAAVCTAYGWPATVADDDLLAKLLALNLSRAGSAAPAAPTDDDSE